MFRSESSSGILQLIDPNATVSVTLSWTKGNGARRVVIARLSNTVNYLPADTIAYTANSLFGAGSSFTLKGLSGGKYGMYSGRVASSTSNDIGSSDAAAAWEDRNLVGYYDTDVNLDGLVDAGDRSQIWNNLGSTSKVVQ